MAVIKPATSYIPDINFGRPLSDAQVYIMTASAIAPKNANDINVADLLSVTYVNDAGNLVAVTQPLKTTKGGCLYEGCKTDIKQFLITENDYLIATYDKHGNLEYSGVASSTDGIAYISESAPTGRIIPGARWYKPSDAVTYIYYVDDDSSQWVQENMAAPAFFPVADYQVFKLADFGGFPGGDITQALKDLVAAAIASGEPWYLRLPVGTMTISDEIDLSGCAKPFMIEGLREGTILVPTPYGSAKSMFKMPSNLPCSLWGLEFGDGVTAYKQHPIAIYIPESGRVSLRDITAGALGNTVIWCSRPFNADWTNLDLFFNGTQPIHKNVSVSDITLSVNTGSNQMFASAPVFDNSDIGKVIYIVENTTNNTAIAVKINGVTSSTQATADRQFAFTATGRRFSYTAVTGDITAASNALATNADMFEADDVGRFIYIDGAGVDGRLLISRIASFVDARNVTLVDAATTTVTEAQVYLTPTVFVGGYETTSTAVNDIVINNMLIEGFKGPGLVVSGGTHFYANNLKTHGRAWQEFSDFGQTCAPLHWNNTNRSVIDGWELEFCGPTSEGGTIKVRGESPGLLIESLTVNSPCFGEYLFEFLPTDTAKSSLDLGNVISRVDLSLYKGLVKTDTAAQRRRLSGHGYVRGESVTAEAGFQLPNLTGSSRSFPPTFINDDSVFSFKPASPAGFVAIAADDSGSFQGLLYFRTDNTAVATVLAAPANVKGGAGVQTGVTGIDGDVTVTMASDGKMYIENRSGAGRRFHVSILG